MVSNQNPGQKSVERRLNQELTRQNGLWAHQDAHQGGAEEIQAHDTPRVLGHSASSNWEDRTKGLSTSHRSETIFEVVMRT